jgi:hypothetical protein
MPKHFIVGFLVPLVAIARGGLWILSLASYFLLAQINTYGDMKIYTYI